MWPFDLFHKNEIPEESKDVTGAGQNSDTYAYYNQKTAEASESTGTEQSDAAETEKNIASDDEKAPEAKTEEKTSEEKLPGHVMEIDAEAIIARVEGRAVEADEDTDSEDTEENEAEVLDPKSNEEIDDESPISDNVENTEDAENDAAEAVLTSDDVSSADPDVTENKVVTPAADDTEAPRSLYDWTRSKKNKKKGSKKKAKKSESSKGSSKSLVYVGNTVFGDGIPKVCVPIVGRTEEEILAQAADVVKKAPNLVEWRVDYLSELFESKTSDEIGSEESLAVSASVGEILHHLAEALGEVPLLFTCRTAREGGEADLTVAEYIALNRWASNQPEVRLIDVEALHPDLNAEALISELHHAGARVIASTHNFAMTPKKAELLQIFDRLEKTGADILKVAVMPKKAKDVLRLMSVTAEVNAETACPIVTMAMGELGRISRVSGELTGSAMTFAAIGASSAPGQMSIDDVRDMMNKLH